MNSTFQDRLAVFVVPLLCCALVVAWTLIRGVPIADEDIGLVANAPVGEPSSRSAVPTAPIAPAITAATTPHDAALDEPSRDPQSSDVQALDSNGGDYSRPDPLPLEMLLRSYQAASLGIVEPRDQTASVERVTTTVARIADAHQ